MGGNNPLKHPSVQQLSRVLDSVGAISTTATLSFAIREKSLTGPYRLAYLGVGDSGGYASSEGVAKWTNEAVKQTEAYLSDLVDLGFVQLWDDGAKRRWVAVDMIERCLSEPTKSDDKAIKKWSASAAQRLRIMRRDNFLCYYCGSGERLTIDHVVPRSAGGGNEDDNLVACCLVCNTQKGTKSASDFIEWRHVSAKTFDKRITPP